MVLIIIMNSIKNQRLVFRGSEAFFQKLSTMLNKPKIKEPRKIGALIPDLSCQGNFGVVSIMGNVR